MLDPRHLVVSLGLGSLAISVENAVGVRHALAAQAPRSTAEWMNAWTGEKARKPQGGLFIYRFKEPMWALLKPIAWQADAGTSDIARVEVPEGFVTDFASIPRAFYSMLRPDGDYTYPAILHDYLYWTQTRPRSECDEVIRLAMLDFKIDPVTVKAIYTAVRTFGQSAWNANAKLQANGEKRILAKLPTDPRITWADWKEEGGRIPSIERSNRP